MVDPQILLGIAGVLITLFTSTFYIGRKIGENSAEVKNVKLEAEFQQKEINELKLTVKTIVDTTNKIQVAVAVLSENIGKISEQLIVLARKVDRENGKI